MEDNDVKEIVKEVAKDRAKDIYDDTLKPSAKECGEILQTVVGLFNNVVLYPLKVANITFKYKLEKFKQEMEQKLDKIPNEKLIEPSVNIAGLTLEALRYTIDIEEIREMYLELLASSMNSDLIDYVHPA